MRGLIIVFWMLGACSAFAAESQLNAVQALVEMTNAMNKLNFQGTVAFLKNGNLETHKYFHAVVNGKQQERLLSLNTPLKDVVRADGKVRCIFKKSQKVIVDHRPFGHSFLMDLPEDPQALEAFYQLSMAGEEQVAMLPAYVISVQPKDQFRYGRRIWLDKKQFLPLKVEVYSPEKKTLQQVVFTDIQMMDQLSFETLEKAAEGKEIEHIHQMQSLPLNQSELTFNQIPDGFKIKFFMRMTLPKSKQAIEHFLLTDGFSSVSVYFDREKTEMSLGRRSVGAINSYSRKMNDYLLTVMGEVPSKAVEYIANGVQLRVRHD